MLIKNKRGDMAVVLVVFLTLLITSVSLFVFVTSSNKINAKISDAGIVNNVQIKENEAEFYIKETAEDSVVDSYTEIIQNENYIEQPAIYNSEKEVEFKDLNSGADEELNKKFNEKFKGDFENYEFEKEHLKKLKDVISKDGFSALFNGQAFQLNINAFEMNDSSAKVNVSYTPKIFLEINLTRIGLDSFNKIYLSKEECKTGQTAEAMKTCFEDNLRNFNVEVVEKTNSANEKYFLVKLKSKKTFLTETGFENLEFSFVPV